MIPVIGHRTSLLEHVIVIAIVDWLIGGLFGMTERNLSIDTRFVITNFMSPASKWNLATLPVCLLFLPTRILAEDQPQVPRALL
jgi:hypothetical protein